MKNKKDSARTSLAGHFFPKGKKGVELSMNVVIILVILLIVAVSVIAVFGKLFGKEAGQIERQIDSLGDEDKDGVANFFDKCPCSPGEREFDGCLTQQDLDDTKGKPRDESCFKK